MVASGGGSCNGLRQDVDTKIGCVRILDFVKERQVLPKHLTQIFFLLMCLDLSYKQFLTSATPYCNILQEVQDYHRQRNSWEEWSDDIDT